MRKLLIILECCLILALIYSLAMSAGGRKPIAEYTGPQAQTPKTAMGGEKAACQLTGFNGNPSFYITDYGTGDQTVQYIDPVDCGAGTTYPFEITSLDFSLWDDGGALSYPVQVDLVVYAMADPGNSCGGPGVELCRVTASCGSSFNYPGQGTITLSSPCCVSGPFFIGLEYSDPGAGPFPSMLFDNNLTPDTCDLYMYQWFGSPVWTEWYDAHTGAMIGYPSMWVNGETGSSSCDSDDLYLIDEVYENIEALEGQEVRVMGEYLWPDAGIIVQSYMEFITNELMPMNSDMSIVGSPPLSDFWHGGTVIVTGVVTSAPDPYPAWGDDTIQVTIEATSYEYVYEGYLTQAQMTPVDDQPILGESYDWFAPVDCDPCKFAILVCSGDSARYRGRHDYWLNMNKLFRYKVDSLGYCSTNVFIHHDTGVSGNTAQIPHHMVRGATEAAIGASHDTISQRIRACGDDTTTVQKMFTNHGSNNRGVVLAEGRFGEDRHYLSPKELRQMQQKLIDSCCDFLFDEFITCYGEDMMDSLKNLNNLSKTQIHANTDAPRDAKSWSPVRRNGVFVPDRYLGTKIDSLAAGKSYEQAVRYAEQAYLKFVCDTVWKRQLRRAIANLNTWLAANPGHRLAARKTAKRNKYVQDTLNIKRQCDSLNCPSWVRHTFKRYCDCKEFVAPPGGELKLKFTGSGGCGNISIWEKQADGKWKRVRRWNWNLPGSSGYQPGNNERVLHVPETSSGIYVIHNDNGEFTVTVDSYGKRPDAAEDASNATTFAGFSLGCNDGSLTEFGYRSFHDSAWGVDQDGFNLDSVPSCFDYWEAAPGFTGFFDVYNNEYWSDMEVYLNVLGVSSAGSLIVHCPDAYYSWQTIYLDTAGEYVVPLGAISGSGTSSLSLQLASYHNTSICMDSWGLRTTVSPWPESNCIGIRGNVDFDAGDNIDISDLVYLVDYMFNGGPPPFNLEEADVDGSGGIDIADLVYLVDFMFTGGPPPVPCP